MTAPAGPWPTVSVVVPVHDGVEDLRRCLGALLAQDYPAEAVTVWVVDNASREDVSAAVPADGRFVLLSEAAPGSYAARNRALQEVEGEVVAFTDADCTPEPDWLRRGVEALQRTGTGTGTGAGGGLAMVGGAVQLTFAGGRPRTAWELYESAHAFPQEDYLAKQRFAVTANLFTWRSTLLAVGPFDAALRSRGDAEWGQRVAAGGGAQAYAAAAVVHHPARSTWPAMVTKTLRVARGRCDVDLARGRGARHFAGVAAAHARLAGEALLHPPVRAGVLTTPGERVRYLLAHTSARALFVAVNLRCALRAASVTASGRRPTLPRMTAPRPDLDLVHRLAAAWQEAVTGAVGSPRAALLDFPGHKNVGDSLIWLGERALLERARIGVSYVSEHHSLVSAALRARNGSAPVLLHGGGNFGDVWPDYQRFRDRVAAEFADRRLVQLPQSLWYQDRAAAAQSSRHLVAHPDFHLMVRDRRSLDEATAMFPDAVVSLVPDAAFGLGPLPRSAPAEVDVLCLMREDREGVGHAQVFKSAGLPVTDWGTHRFSRRAWTVKRRTVGAVRRVETATTATLTQPVLRAAYGSMAQQNLTAGIRTFSRGRVVITDRLHGHILCLLLGVPHVVLDNSYGKIRDFREAWTSSSELTRTASTADEAIDAARELLGSSVITA